MVFSLSSERPALAATSSSFFAGSSRWLAGFNAERKKRRALNDLLALDAARLEDIGLSRGDILAALETSGRTGALLHRARCNNSAL